MVSVDILALWHPGVSATVLVDGLHRSHRCLRWICHSCYVCGWFQGVPISCRPCLSHTIVVFGTLKYLAQFAALKLVCSIPHVLSLLTMVRWCKTYTPGNPFAYPGINITRPFGYLRGKCSFRLMLPIFIYWRAFPVGSRHISVRFYVC